MNEYSKNRIAVRTQKLELVKILNQFFRGVSLQLQVPT
jgi:hypothetical protein